MEEMFETSGRDERDRGGLDATSEGGWPDPVAGEESTKRGLFGRLKRDKKKAAKGKEKAPKGAEKPKPGEILDPELDNARRKISLMEPQSFTAEQFRTLRGRIDALAERRPISTVAVTSANAGEGKSTSSINLAFVSAMSVDRRVLLMDCDMRRPALASALGLEPKAGLAEILTGRATLDEAIINYEASAMDVLCVKEQPSNPSELLASKPMRELIAEASNRYDRVILDTPITLGLPDSRVISDLCDGIVFVVRAGMTVLEDIEACLDLLDRDRVLGLLLNGADAESKSYGYY